MIGLPERISIMKEWTGVGLATIPEVCFVVLATEVEVITTKAIKPEKKKHSKLSAGFPTRPNPCTPTSQCRSGNDMGNAEWYDYSIVEFSINLL